MGKGGLRAIKAGVVVAAMVAFIGSAVETRADDKCLAQFETQQGGSTNLLADGAQVCGVASGKSCTFQLALCLNTKEAGCAPASFTGPKKFRAKGHCGPVGKVSVNIPSGDAMTCGSFAGVTVRTKKNGKAEGKCTVSASVKTAKKNARKDKDTIMLMCMPSTATCPSTTTTSTTGAGTTTTTMMPPASSLGFTVLPGTTSCGGAGLASPPPAPNSGALNSNTACSTSISPLGLGCLYFGGGAATVVAGGAIPDGSTSFLAITSPGNLGGSAGTSADNCTKGAGPGKHCANKQPPIPTCTTDADCGGAAGSCALDANCLFGPPLPILSPAPFGSLTTCVLNIVQSDAAGTFDAATGNSSVNLPLSSRVYISGNTTSPCPKCLSGTCDSTWKTNTNTVSPDAGAACTAVGSKMTTNQCRPNLAGFQAPLPVSLNPLTTGTTSKTSATGMFCTPQTTAGAFGQATTQCISETGMAAGSLADGNPHNSHLVSVFCIPGTGNAAVDGVADLPGPGAFSLNGNAQVH